VRAWRGSQDRIRELELRLQRAVDDAREAADVRELRRYMGVGELVRAGERAGECGTDVRRTLADGLVGVVIFAIVVGVVIVVVVIIISIIIMMVMVALL
jgi:hypothetical protein